MTIIPAVVMVVVVAFETIARFMNLLWKLFRLASIWINSDPACERISLSLGNRRRRSRSFASMPLYSAYSLLRSCILLYMCCSDSVLAYNVGTSWRNPYAFAVLHEDSTVSTFGYDNSVNDTATNHLSNVTAIYSSVFKTGGTASTGRRRYGAFAALHDDGSVSAWGAEGRGGTGMPSHLRNVKTIYSSQGSFAALQNDGRVKVWGTVESGGGHDIETNSIVNGLRNVTDIFPHPMGFVALQSDGTAIAWGSTLGLTSPIANVKSVYCNSHACASVLTDKTVKV